MRLLAVAFVLAVCFGLAILDANLKAWGWSQPVRLRVALWTTFGISILIAIAGYNGWFTGWGIDAELRQ